MAGKSARNTGTAIPKVQHIGFGDLKAVLVAGVKDFARAPLFGLFFGGIYVLGGLLAIAFVSRFDMHYMIYPLAIGFPLVGPFVAVGLYEVSRCLQEGRALSWSDVLTAVWQQKGREMSVMAFVTLFIMWMWMYQIRLLVALALLVPAVLLLALNRLGVSAQQAWDRGCPWVNRDWRWARSISS